MAWTVGEVARTAKVSVRALHHYDALGLLVPSERSAAGYRLYGVEDLERLQQVLFFRELGFALEDIRGIMSDPLFDRRAALDAQRSLLAEKARRTTGMLAAIDRSLRALDEGVPMDEKEMFEVFGDFDPKDYEAEVMQRWGSTDAYSESARRAKRYTKEDWKRFRAESDANGRALVEALERGLPPGDPAVMDLAEEARSSTAGSTPARTRCMWAWPRCTSRTRGSPQPTRRCTRAWRGSCMKRSRRTPRGTAPRTGR
jgi:DNA-binding transcriptional MerR regulator